MPLRLSIPLPGPFSYSTSLRMRKRTARRAGKGFGYLLISPFLMSYWMLKFTVVASIAVGRGIYVAAVWTAETTPQVIEHARAAHAAWKAWQARRAAR